MVSTEARMMLRTVSFSMPEPTPTGVEPAAVAAVTSRRRYLVLRDRNAASASSSASLISVLRNCGITEIP